MQPLRQRLEYICSDCLLQQSSIRNTFRPKYGHRRLHSTPTRSLPPQSSPEPAASNKQDDNDGKGAMSRRLEQMTDEGLENTPTRADKIVQESGFSEDLKKKLEARILDAKFRSDNAEAFAEVSLPLSAGKGTRDIAAAAPWTGQEALSDTALRMLDDAHKPLRIPSRSKRIVPNPIDLRPKRQSVDTGTRLANARDKTSIYAMAQDNTMTAAEKETMRRQLQERFQPGARSLPATVAGLQSVASQRIEDAIARGLFKNIPRGKGVNVERDHNADSPFIDTTEYFMNKIVKKQDLTPPWIEKQAEIHSTAARFRGRLRADWKRHAARTIASKGGSLEDQIARAKAYARAEAIDNPPPKAKKEVLSSIDAAGNLTHVNIEQKESKEPGIDSKITVTEFKASAENTLPTQPASQPAPPIEPAPEPTLPPFRDPAWLTIESPYHTMAITSLNNLTRSYNLMAPELAKKPYFNLERELKACYAEIAPQLADEIRNRALAPRVKVEIVGHTPGGVLERFSGGEKARVVDDRRKPYGFKEFWRDLFAAGDDGDSRGRGKTSF